MIRIQSECVAVACKMWEEMFTYSGHKAQSRFRRYRYNQDTGCSKKKRNMFDIL